MFRVIYLGLCCCYFIADFFSTLHIFGIEFAIVQH